MKRPSLKTSTIIALSVSIGMIAGITASAIAAQPNMQMALNSLIAADQYLARALDNKGGHKAKAHQLIAIALVEVKLGIRAGAN